MIVTKDWICVAHYTCFPPSTPMSFSQKKKKKKKGKIWLIQAGFTGLCNALFLVLNRYSNFTFKIIFCFGRLGGNR